MEGLWSNYLADSVRSFRNYKKLAERAFEQVSDEEFSRSLDEEGNSIAVIVKHIAGNARSRWRDLFTSDGEKADRNRDTEFEMIGDTRASLMEFWETGWQTLFDAIEPLSVDDFGRTITIRGEPHSLRQALLRGVTHAAYHVGQILYLARWLEPEGEWLTIAPGKSAEYRPGYRRGP